MHHSTQRTASYSRLLRTVSGLLLSVSKDGHSTTSTGNLSQCPVTLTLEKFLLTCKWNFLYFSLHSSSLVLSQETTRQSLSLLQPEWSMAILEANI